MTPSSPLRQRLLSLASATLLLFSLLWAGLSAAAQAEQTRATDPASYAALAELLANDTSRKQLIEDLRAMAQSDATQKTDSAATQDADHPTGMLALVSDENGEPAVSQRLAQGLQAFTASLAADFEQTTDVLGDLARGDARSVDRMERWWPALQALLIALAAVLGAYFLLRMLAAQGFARLNTWIHKKEGSSQDEAARTAARADHGMGRLRKLTLSRKLVGVLAALLIDLAATALAALAGYVIVLALAEGSRSELVLAFQFLSAFVMIEAAKAIARGVFATRYDRLRLLPLRPDTARYWNHSISLLIGLTGYCLLVIVPVTQAIFAPSIGRLLGLAIMLCVYIYGIRVVWSQRLAVKAGLDEWAQRAEMAVFGTLIRTLARTWHILALAYFTILLVVSQADQQQALAFMMRATAQSLLAAGIGALLAAGLSALAARHISLPEHWRTGFPLLENRINAYVPAALRGMRLLITVIVALIILDAWHAFDLGAWLASPGGQAAVALVLRLSVILAIAALTWTVLASLIEHRLGASSGPRKASEREKTLLMLFRNAAAIVICTMTILIVLSQIGIDVGPLIAGAGVAGLAIGFGAQKLVQDVISGVFIQLENGMNQNDIVEVAGLFGTVEKITIRSVALRTLDGGYHLIPFSAIDKVSNHTRDYGYHYGEYYVAHRENVDDAVAQLRLAFKDLMADAALAAQVLSDIDIPGVTALDQHGFRIRVLIKTTPGNQWMIQRGFNRLVKQRFDAAGIELPYPQTVLHFGRDKTGYAAPVDVRAVDTLQQAQQSAPAAGQTMRPALDTP